MLTNNGAIYPRLQVIEQSPPALRVEHIPGTPAATRVLQQQNGQLVKVTASTYSNAASIYQSDLPESAPVNPLIVTAPDIGVLIEQVILRIYYVYSSQRGRLRPASQRAHVRLLLRNRILSAAPTRKRWEQTVTLSSIVRAQPRAQRNGPAESRPSRQHVG